MKILVTESQLKHIVLENKKIKAGSPEELVGLLELLPVDETAKYLAEEIYQDVMKYYNDDIHPSDKKYVFHPEEKCLTPYELEIDFRPSNNMTGLGYASEDYIQVKYLSKDSMEYRAYPRGAGNLIKTLYHIIKHECSHFYLKQRGVENCLYNTHPDGMKKYYQDRQELVLHSREIFDRFEEDFPSWKDSDLEYITKRIEARVKRLRNHTNINMPFNVGTQKKYLNFILNTYIKPNLKTI
jgi:hypothetical protein